MNNTLLVAGRNRRMKPALFQLFLALLALLPALAASEFRVTSNTVVVVAGMDAAREALGTEDDFIRALSDFDRASRMKSEQPPSRGQFLKFIQGEAMAWSAPDIARIGKAAAGAREKLSKFKLMLPERVLLVQTTGKEEANTAYCRGTNIIVMARRFVNGPPAELESMLIHELFHILSRNNPELRTKLYALIGFKPCGEIPFPVELDSRRITNPDAPRLDFQIEVTYQEKKMSAVPVLFATPERWTKERGGEFLSYFTWKLMAVENVNENWRALRSNGKPVLLGLRDISGFRQQIGEQPGPLLQAEEILAEYFVKVVEGDGEVPATVRDGMNRLLKR
jgi:hypothetical protein